MCIYIYIYMYMCVLRIPDNNEHKIFPNSFYTQLVVAKFPERPGVKVTQSGSLNFSWSFLGSLKKGSESPSRKMSK